jgi:hypothetical protein
MALTRKNWRLLDNAKAPLNRAGINRRSFAVQVQMVMPENKLTALLPGAKFSDSYCLVVDEPDIDAITAARRAMGRAPGWIHGLMHLRNRIASLFDLKPARLALLENQDGSERVGAFPVISSAAERVVLGFDDKHLDFRIVVDVAKIDASHSQITATTLVRPHNLLGRTYLGVVLPFHRMIVPAMLAQAVRL